MSNPSLPTTPGTHSVAMALLPIMAAVLAGFVVIGAALPVLPLHVSHHLGFGSVVVGVVAGAQFVNGPLLTVLASKPIKFVIPLT